MMQVPAFELELHDVWIFLLQGRRSIITSIGRYLASQGIIWLSSQLSSSLIFIECFSPFLHIDRSVYATYVDKPASGQDA